MALRWVVGARRGEWDLPRAMIRVTGGAYRGRRLVGASGATRPATARMRAAIFNRPDVQAVVEGRVLDLYAGAGLLGVEALSRGATVVDFVERERRVCAVIAQNLAALGVADQGRVHCVPVERCGGRIEPPYDLCFADPPYPLDATAALERLLERGLLRVGGLLLWRHPAARAAEMSLGPLVRSDRRRYGDGVLETYMAGASI